MRQSLLVYANLYLVKFDNYICNFLSLMYVLSLAIYGKICYDIFHNRVYINFFDEVFDMIKKFKHFIDLLGKHKRLKRIVIILSVLALILFMFLITFLLTRIESSKGLNIAISSEPSTLDPTFFVGDEEGTLMVNLFEGLMRTDENGEAVPCQASSYSVSEDGKTYTFHISEKAKWSDGTAVTAEDFAFAWRRTANPYNNSEYSYMFENIKGYDEIYEKYNNDEEFDMNTLSVNAKDSRTLVVKLKEKDGAFLKKCAFPAFAPLCEAQVVKNRRTWSTNKDLFVSNGAYVLSDWSRGSYLVLSLNKEYYNYENLKVRQIKAYFISDDNEALSKFKSQKILLSLTMDDEIEKKMARKSPFKQTDLCGTYYLSYNMSKKPFDNSLVRQALTLAVDRNEIIKECVGKKGEAAFSLLGNGFTNGGNTFRSTGKIYIEDDFDLNKEKARELLKDAGFENGKGFPEFEIIYNDNRFNKSVLEKVAEMWEENLGIKCKLKPESWSHFSSDRAGENYTVAKDGKLIAYNDAGEMFYEFDSKTNHCGKSDKSLNSLVVNIKNTTGENRINLCHQAEDIIMNNYYICPLFSYCRTYLVSSRLSNYYVSAEGFAYLNNVNIKMF